MESHERLDRWSGFSCSKRYVMETKKTIRVVLADDHPMVRRGVRRILEKSSDIVVVGEADTGASTLCLVYDLKPDVLLLDIEMPDMKGDQVTRELRRRRFPISIIVLSGCDDGHFMEEMLQMGADEYLVKDTSPDTIRQAVHQVAQNSSRFSSIYRPPLTSFIFP